MEQIGYKPDLYLRDPTDYNPDFVETGGDAVDGTVVFLNFVPFEEANTNKEMGLYQAGSSRSTRARHRRSSGCSRGRRPGSSSSSRSSSAGSSAGPRWSVR